MNNKQRVREQLEYERECLKECLNKDLRPFTAETANLPLYYQFIKEDLNMIEKSLGDIDRPSVPVS